MPYDHRNTTPRGPFSGQMRSLLEELNRLHCQKRCMVGSGGGSVGYVFPYLSIRMKYVCQLELMNNCRNILVLEGFGRLT